jgi:hypothetical protein
MIAGEGLEALNEGEDPMSVDVKTSRQPGKSAVSWGRSARTRNVHVDVFANTKDGFVEFSHEWKFDDEPAPRDPGGMIDLPAGKTAYQLHFHLKDHTDPKKDLRFIDPCSEAMWVAVGDDCPTCAGNGAGQIQFNHSPKRHQLIVDDLNSNVPAMIFKYALRFDGTEGQQPGNPPKQCPPYEYDPEFKNGGGNT